MTICPSHVRTPVSLSDRLPLTCTRAGTCCHGRAVWITPVDLARLADALGESRRQFRDHRTELGGTRLRMDGSHRWRGRAACSLYDPDSGCRAHSARPLACRLFPLGRERGPHGERLFFEGSQFPCLAGCPEVTTLPSLTVAEALAEQDLRLVDRAEHAYRALAAELADDALQLWHASQLARDHADLPQRWRQLGRHSDQRIAWLSDHDLLDPLTLLSAPIGDDLDHALATQHAELSAALAQRHPPGCNLADLTLSLMALALHLSSAVGSDSTQTAQRWADRATPPPTTKPHP